MKKFFKVLGIAFLCIVLILGGLLYWQRDHIKALISAVKYSGTELDEMMLDTREDLKKAVESFAGEELRDYTDEEQQQIERGEVTSDEVMAKIMNEAVEKKITQSAASQENAAGSQTAGEKTADIIINEHIAQLYTLKSSYMAQIDSMLAEAEAEYYAIAEGGSKGKEAKQVLIPKYVSILTGWESACDADVEAILSSLTGELKARNHSLDIIKTIRSAYENEKNIKMAQIINEYK